MFISLLRLFRAWYAPYRAGSSRQANSAEPRLRRHGAKILAHLGYAAARRYWIAKRLLPPPVFFGNVSSNTPSLYLASAFAASTSVGKLKLRIMEPQ
jgi:hypothetical protein